MPTITLPARLPAFARRALARALSWLNQRHLPEPAVLPTAGAVVGVYSGLLAGIFSNLIALVSAVALSPFSSPPRHTFLSRISEEASQRAWHFELMLLAGLPSLLALYLSRFRWLPAGALMKRRLRILALLVLGALGLYYPLVGLTVLNTVLRGGRPVAESVGALPWFGTLLVPLLGGLLAGRTLRNSPETHGHGIPEVQKSIRADGEGLNVRRGLLKIWASSITLGTGGSAGREGPIVYGGAALAATAGRTLGFSRRELTILLASGAGAGIAASFNAPIAGAIFAFEIILREFELKVLSPIILASVSATLVGRGVMGATPLVRRIPYQMVSGWEVVPYVILGLLCGLLAYAFVWLLHSVEAFFAGQSSLRGSKALSRWPLPLKAGLGGLIVGGLALLNPTVWATGHHFTNEAASGRLAFGFLVTACVFKLVGTAVTIGSGGSGGTFFPATVIGAMAGGAFGSIVNGLLPSVTAPSGAYALVGMGAAVAGLTRGPLTGMMMVYELTGNYRIILPLMLACTIASALCHALVSRKQSPGRSTRDLLNETPVRSLMVPLPPATPELSVRAVVDLIVKSGETALPALDGLGQVTGIIQLHELHDVWQDDALSRSLLAVDVMRTVPVVTGDEDLHTALRTMNRNDIDVLPALDERGGTQVVGLITRAAIRRYISGVSAVEHATGEFAVAPTEVSR